MAIPEPTRPRPRGAKDSGATALPLWPPPRDGWIAIASVALLYAAHWFYGALTSDTAMVMNMAAAAFVGAVLLAPRLREDILRLKGVTAPAVCFLLVLAVGLWTLTPWTPGGPHPVWAYVGVSPGASTIDRSATIIEIVKLLGLACLFVVGAACGARDDRARYAVQLTLAVGVGFGLWALLASVSGQIYQSQGRRLEAHFLNPNTAGTFFAILLMLAIAELARAWRTRGSARINQSLILAAACLVFAICLLDTASRGAATALLGGGLAYLVLQLATGRLKLTRAVVGLLVAIVALLGIVAVAGEQLIDRMFESHESSIVRSAIWQVHWRAFLDSPLFGYGLGSAESVNKSLLTLSNFDILWNIRAILNVYLQWLEEAGVVGAAPMFLTIALLIWTTWRGALRRSRMTGLLAGLLAADVVVLIHGATDFGLEVPSVAALWAWLLGLQFSLSQGTSSR